MDDPPGFVEETLERPRLTARLSAALLLCAALAPARAGDYHDVATLVCADCHVVHLRPAEAVGASRPRAPVGPLLKQDVNELCLACHDESTRAPDVLGANFGKHPGDVRQAGYLNRLGVGDTATGHTLGSDEAAPGSNPPWRPADEPHGARGLDCIHCHAPHGTTPGEPSAWRNLRSDAGRNRPGEGAVSYNVRPGANDLSRDVFQREALRYDESAVDFNEPDRTDSAIARFCAGCHGEFHGPPGDPTTVGGVPGSRGRFEAFLRHPAAGVDLGSGSRESASVTLYNAHANKVKVMTASGVWNPAGADATPTCVSCHKAHGNGNAFGLIYRSGTGRPTEDGDARGTRVEHLCGQCHGETPLFARL